MMGCEAYVHTYVGESNYSWSIVIFIMREPVAVYFLHLHDDGQLKSTEEPPLQTTI